MTLGLISGALLFIGKDFHGLSSFQEELLTSILLIGAVVGALFAGKIADKIGRRPTVLGTAAIFVVGVLLAALSPGYGVLLVARVVIGLAVGSASMVVPLYIGESAPPPDPRRVGQLQPAGDHLGHSDVLPSRLRAGILPELAADVRPGCDPGDSDVPRDVLPAREPALARRPGT